MTLRQAVNAVAPWMALAAATALAATIAVFAPQAGSGMLAALIAAWTLLGIIRVAIVVRLSRMVARSVHGMHG